MKVPVRDLKGSEVDQIDLDDSVFGVPMRTAVVHQALVRQRANSRQGTSSTKTRGEVAGGGKKPWAQKHTGRARTGSRRSPIFRHGGITFGPRPRDYSQGMPKKMRRLAIKCMLSDKHGSGTLTVIQALDLTDGKTQEVVKLLGALSIQGSTLVVTRNPDEKVKRSAKNLSKVKTLPAALLNVGDLLRYESLVMTVDAVRQAEELWAKPGNRQQLPEEAEPTRKRRSPRKPAP